MGVALAASQVSWMHAVCVMGLVLRSMSLGFAVALHSQLQDCAVMERLIVVVSAMVLMRVESQPLSRSLQLVACHLQHGAPPSQHY